MAKTIRKGSRGDDVQAAQVLLFAKGYQIEVDGIFGAGTHRVVCSFQASQGLDVDGIVGKVTWDALEGTDAPVTEEEYGDADEAARWMCKIRERCGDEKRLAFCEQALHELGMSEDPRGSNRGPRLDNALAPFGQSYVEHHQIGANSVPWCMVWVSSCLARSLSASSWEDLPWGSWYGAASQIGAWGQENGVYVQGHEMPLPGDILVMTRDGSGSDVGGGTSAGHVGIVLSVSGAHVWSVDGNVSDSVQIKKRKRSQVDYVSWRDVP